MRIYILSLADEDGLPVLSGFAARAGLAAAMAAFDEDLIAPADFLIDEAEATGAGVYLVDAEGGPVIHVLDVT